MKTSPPDRTVVVKELEERLRKKWDKEQPKEASPGKKQEEQDDTTKSETEEEEE